ncbi:peptide chain release factor H [Spongorhabdus nitratireducens]
MIILQLSAGQGPEECARAVALGLRRLEAEAHSKQVRVKIIESQQGARSGTYKSVLVALEGEGSHSLAQQWTGSFLWICPSPYRPAHRRKNWFFGGECYEVSSQEVSHEIRYKTCRASGAGGQHVNKTDSAVQATHIETGLSVRVESERSQHANKRLATALLLHKLEQQGHEQDARNRNVRRQQHWELERGNPRRTFHGPSFKAEK